MEQPTELFFAAQPGLEPFLLEEAAAAGFEGLSATPGGVISSGGWSEGWRANLVLRGAGRILARVASFRAAHLSELDKRARRLDWASILSADAPVRVEAVCRKSRIYHSGAARQRIADAVRDATGAPIVAGSEVDDTAEAIGVAVRIEKDICVISIDLSGAPLHKRGFRQAVSKAPLRETMAALLLRAASYDSAAPVFDPMCGSGALPLEAAEIAAGLAPGRDRPFAFERLRSFDAEAWSAMRAQAAGEVAEAPEARRIFGADRDAGAIEASRANAERAGVSDWIAWRAEAIGEARPPVERPGLVIVNPPYGERLGDAKALKPLYITLGRVLRERFTGWRIAIISSAPDLVRATGLPFEFETAPVPHGGLRIKLYAAAPMG